MPRITAKLFINHTFTLNTVVCCLRAVWRMYVCTTMSDCFSYVCFAQNTKTTFPRSMGFLSQKFLDCILISEQEHVEGTCLHLLVHYVFPVFSMAPTSIIYMSSAHNKSHVCCFRHYLPQALVVFLGSMPKHLTAHFWCMFGCVT